MFGPAAKLIATFLGWAPHQTPVIATMIGILLSSAILLLYWMRLKRSVSSEERNTRDKAGDAWILMLRGSDSSDVGTAKIEKDSYIAVKSKLLAKGGLDVRQLNELTIRMLSDIRAVAQVVDWLRSARVWKAAGVLWVVLLLISIVLDQGAKTASDDAYPSISPDNQAAQSLTITTSEPSSDGVTIPQALDPVMRSDAASSSDLLWRIVLSTCCFLPILVVFIVRTWTALRIDRIALHADYNEEYLQSYEFQEGI